MDFFPLETKAMELLFLGIELPLLHVQTNIGDMFIDTSISHFQIDDLKTLVHKNFGI